MDLSNVSEQEKRKHFEKLAHKFYEKPKDTTCMFCNCNRQSIGSHSISKKYYLKKIACNGEVGEFVSKRTGDLKDFRWEKTGIKNASVFMGYCKEHDAIFKSIDENGITTVKDLLLQCYRSICFWYKKEMMASEILGEVQSDSVDTAKSMLRQTMPSFDYDQLLTEIRHQEDRYDFIGPLRILKEHFENILFQTGKEAELNKRLQDSVHWFGDVEVMYHRAEEKIPVVLNSMNSVRQGKVFHIVLPNDSHTDLIVINATHKNIQFAKAWEARTQNMLNVISLIESWMIGEETWYVDPDVFAQLPGKRLAVIKDDLRYSPCERELWQPYDVSIFDGLRRKYLCVYKSLNTLPPEREEQENNRFTLPARANKEQREDNLNQAILKQHMNASYGERQE